jgi:hypothetical protein
MLNVKYVIQTDKEGKEFPAVNPDANGNAWFVNDVKLVNKANDEMKMLDRLILKKQQYLIYIYMEINLKCSFKRNLDTTGTIVLNIYKP